MDTVVKFQKKKKELSPLASRFMRVLEEKSYTGYRLSKDFPKLLEGSFSAEFGKPNKIKASHFF